MLIWGLMIANMPGVVIGQGNPKITLNYKQTDKQLVYPLNLVLTPAAGNTGYYQYDSLSGSFTSAKTLQINPRANDWVISYYSTDAIGTVSTTKTATYHVYTMNATIPQATYDTLAGYGIVKNRNVIDGSFQSTLMAPPLGDPTFDPCTVGFDIYLPEDYYTNPDQTRKYPVVYYFHGGGANENAFLDDIWRVHQAISNSVIKPVVYVMVHGGEDTWFIHDSPPITPKALMVSYFLNEVIPVVESRYRIRSDQGGRALMGFSMGGFAALKFAFTSGSGMFSSTVGFSPGMDWNDAGMSDALKTDVLNYLNTKGYGIADITAINHDDEIFYYFEQNRQDIAKMGVYLTVGNPTKGELSGIYQSVYNASGSLTKKFDQYSMPYTFHYASNSGHGIPWLVVGNEPFTFIESHFTGGFDGWRQSYFTLAQLTDVSISGPSASPARDGVANLVKYALNRDPRIPAPVGPGVVASNTWIVSFDRNATATDVNLHLEMSTDLSSGNWQEIASSLGGGAVQPFNGATVLQDSPGLANGVQIRISANVNALPKAFVRFRVDRK